MCLREDDLLEARNITGAAKYYAEKELDFIREYCNPSLRTIYARIYRVYGRGSNDVISRWIRASLAGERVQVYNRQNRFDYIFAGDVAEGLLRLAENPRAQGVVNLGSGKARSVQEVLRIIDSLSGLEEQYLGETECFEASCADISKLRALTGWVPPTDLETGIKCVLEYERNRAGKRENELERPEK